MRPHEERVVTENTELDEKRQKLAAFIDDLMYFKLDKIQKSQLVRQFEAMNLYADILGAHIAAFVE